MSFFYDIGLQDLFQGGRVPNTAYPLGELVGYLNPMSAEELGLTTGTAVSVGIIDAHAGGLGVLGPAAKASRKDQAIWNRVLALIGGTSSCHMATSLRPRFIPGVWGPYYGAMIPGAWLNEGGQSATGVLVDHIIADSAPGPMIEKEALDRGETVYQVLNKLILDMQAETHAGPAITSELHVLPDHHGNRSPRADPKAKGMMSGLTLGHGRYELALRYYATIQSVAYGCRHIVEAMNDQGYAISEIFMCGGHVNNSLFLQEHADITGCAITLPQEPDAVLLGAAMLGASAAGIYPDLVQTMEAMSRSGETVKPRPEHSAFHDRKYKVFKRMYEQQKELNVLMNS